MPAHYLVRQNAIQPNRYGNQNIANHLGRTRDKLLLNLGSCHKCKGDLVYEGDEWRCLQCGKYYYPKTHQSLQAEGRHKTWGINASIRSTQVSEARWESSNREIIDHLSAGRSPREIASLTDLSLRRVRSVKDRMRQA